MKTLDKFRGCLLGGAAGDALGFAVEFMTIAQIKKEFGPKGITEYKLTNGKALISDDTQMTLFTANGLLLGTTRAVLRGISAGSEAYCAACYSDWLITQSGDFKKWKANAKDYYPSWLIRIPELHHPRAPGNSCLSAISSGKDGSIENPINDSKGCGGLMRIAPVGIYFAPDNLSGLTVQEIDMDGARIAALTHGHILGYTPAAVMTHILNRIMYGDDAVNAPLETIIEDAIAITSELFGANGHFSYFIRLLKDAIDLSKSNLDDEMAISKIGGGWVAEETLAIALYCSLKYRNNFEKALIASVNHSGDSDSTGSVTGNILGAYLGLDAIPPKFLDHLELRSIITEIADDLYRGYADSDEWHSKYMGTSESPIQTTRSEYV
jgi:ADP-ribosylglycohydrolase